MHKLNPNIPIRLRKNSNRKDNKELYSLYLPIRKRILSHMDSKGITYAALAKLLCPTSKCARAYGEATVKEGGFIALRNICKALDLKLKVSIE